VHADDRARDAGARRRAGIGRAGADQAAPATSSPAAPSPAAPAPQPKTVTEASPQLVAELRPVVERARLRFEARDAGGVLTNVSEQYRSAGLTKAGLREQLLAMFALYEAMRVRLSIDRVQLVDGAVWVYTSGEVTGRLPLLGWMTVLAWQGQPEVARREGAAWRLIGFQD
jgi:hypothetical protein